jgi:hypothetical protein
VSDAEGNAVSEVFSNVVAVVALPAKAAVTVPALKLPLASRATTLDAVLALVASTAHVVDALLLGESMGDVGEGGKGDSREAALLVVKRHLKKKTGTFFFVK